jgi:hypothetical protein
MFGWPPRSATYPGLDLDPSVLAEREALEGPSSPDSVTGGGR